MRIRMAEEEEDGAAVLAIYAQYIATPITFEYRLPPEQEMAARIAAISREYPYLVAEEEGRLLGYAYAHRQMARAAYQWNAELSVYLDKSAVAQGLGTKLYQALEELLRLQGVRTIYGGVTVPNEPSRKLHLRQGFTSIGIYHQTGYKCGQWHDVEWFAKPLLPYGPDPQPIRPVTQLAPEQLAAVLAKYS